MEESVFQIAERIYIFVRVALGLILMPIVRCWKMKILA